MRNLIEKFGKILIVFGLFLLSTINPAFIMLLSVGLLLYIGWECHRSKTRMSILMLLVIFIAAPLLFGSLRTTETHSIGYYMPAFFFIVIGIILTYYKRIKRKIKSR